MTTRERNIILDRISTAAQRDEFYFHIAYNPLKGESEKEIAFNKAQKNDCSTELAVIICLAIDLGISQECIEKVKAEGRGDGMTRWILSEHREKWLKEYNEKVG